MPVPKHTHKNQRAVEVLPYRGKDGTANFLAGFRPSQAIQKNVPPVVEKNPAASVNTQRKQENYKPKPQQPTSNNPSQQNPKDQTLESLKEKIYLSLEDKKKRLQKKLKGFFSWFTWNKHHVEEKIKCLDTLQDHFCSAENKNEVNSIMNCIIDKNQTKTNTGDAHSTISPLIPVLRDVFNKHRAGFIGDTKTYNNLVNDFKKFQNK